MTPDMARVSALIRETAASVILPRFEKLLDSEIREKGPGDLVTVADVEAEDMLTAGLADVIPGALILGEEAAAANPALLALPDGSGDLWVIDPIDGTSNFASGMPLFAVMVGFLRDGEALASWIYDPVKDEMAVAEKGGGAWIDGARMRVAATSEPGAMSGTLSIRFGNRQLVRKIAGRSNLVGSTFSLRCAGQEYLALASGRVHFALYHRLLPWDHAPGVLLHAEAGGFGLCLDRARYSPRRHDGGLLLAPDVEGWEALTAVLIGAER